MKEKVSLPSFPESVLEKEQRHRLRRFMTCNLFFLYQQTYSLNDSKQNMDKAIKDAFDLMERI